MTRVLAVCAEPVGPRMAGPAIRAAELARVLAAAGHDVTLAAPAPSEPPAGVAWLPAGLEAHDALLGAIAAHDVALAQFLPPGLLARAYATGTGLVTDLYNPIVVEVEEAVRGRGELARRVARAATRHAARAHLAAGDLTLCASARQVALWRGLDPRAALAVVPFGMPDAPPQPADPPLLKGVHVPADARVLLWNGGIWDWLDPDTAIAAVDRLPDDVHLVFLGADRPALAARDRHRAVERARAAAAHRPRVHVLAGWVPYAQRGSWLAEADLVVSTHRDTPEARYAFRTRLVDALWAARPIVCTRGDVLADLVERERLGAVVPPGDADAVAAACRAVLDAPPPPARIAQAAAPLRWSSAAAPLLAFCAGGARRPRDPARGRAVREHTRGQYLPLAIDTLARDGASGLARRVARNARRMAGP